MAEEKEKTGYSVDSASLKRIGRVVREFETNSGLPPGTKRRSRFIGPIVEGVMLEDLPGTDDPNAPTKARFQIYTGLHGRDEWGAEPQPSILTLWNRTTSSAAVDDVVFAQEIYPDRWGLLPRGNGYPIWAVNIGSLTPATHPLTGHSTGVAGLFEYDNYGDGENLQITDRRASFIRRDKSGTIADGTLIQLDIVSGKLTIVWADCSPHADLEGLEEAPYP